MQWQSLGDRSWLWTSRQNTEEGRLREVVAMAEALREADFPVPVADVVSSFETVAVHCEPDSQPVVGSILADFSLPQVEDSEEAKPGRLVTIPVSYGDLAELTEALSLSRDEIIQLHSSAEYTVATLGFSPGFPYLLGLPPQLHVPRKAMPAKVPAGSVAIAAGQAGIYPMASQGGWHVLGQTDAPLFRAEADPPTLLRPGDRVRFEPSGPLSLPASSPPHNPSGSVHVEAPGLATTVQDLGRPGWQHLGISPGGASDPFLARVANLLVGNPETSALLETTLQGPRLTFTELTRLAFIGWESDRAGRPLEFEAGSTLDLSQLRPLATHGYVAFGGGLKLDATLGSRATDLRGRFGGIGGRLLQKGDQLAVGQPFPLTDGSDWRVGWPLATSSRAIEIRYLKGRQANWFSRRTRQLFNDEPFTKSSSFDRTGLRLDGPAIHPDRALSLKSQPVVPGSVQIPPAGQPIALLSERQTIGGYPQIAHIISADLPALTRALPGTEVRFREVDLPTARAAWQSLQSELAFLRTGLTLRQKHEK
ncbi:MAG: 5-oxoprolinase subunit PxpB [Verrucomicrobiota bacterium JB023]|nr:5-oxoprolinase subunit PxpB [Verrucomicrobiota bacterium JB023]